MNELMAGLRQLNTMEQKRVLMIMLKAQVESTPPKVGEGGLLAQILKWIAENPEEFKALVLFVISLFV